jgi:hypothetical protein
MSQWLAGLAAMPVQPELQVRSDPEAPYGAVALVLATAQRAGRRETGYHRPGLSMKGYSFPDQDRSNRQVVVFDSRSTALPQLHVERKGRLCLVVQNASP